MNILLLEDHGDSRTVLAHLLTHCGYQVEVASDICAARSSLTNHRFDVLLADIGLPDGESYSLVALAKESSPAIRTIALTGRDTAADLEKGRVAGFDHFLTKPVDFHQLRSILAEQQDSVAAP